MAAHFPRRQRGGQAGYGDGPGEQHCPSGLRPDDTRQSTRRALTFQLAVAGKPRTSDMLAEMREADADNFVDDE